MVEQLMTSDSFIEFRDEGNESWKRIEPIIKDVFPNKEIPTELKNHLIEFVVMRSAEGADRVMSYMDEHDQLLDDSNFLKAVKEITAIMGAKKVETKTDSWVK